MCMNRVWRNRLAMIITSLLTMGCSNLLPSVDKTVDAGWTSYEDAKQAFDKVVPKQTTAEELRALGLDPFVNPNIRLLNYLDLTQIFIPNASIRFSDLDPAVRTCLRAKTACQGYQISPVVLQSHRYGNVLLDVFNFRRQTRTTGWKFLGLILMKQDLVVYKIEAGEPNVLELEDKKNPLGPFQEISISPDLRI